MGDTQLEEKLKQKFGVRECCVKLKRLEETRLGKSFAYKIAQKSGRGKYEKAHVRGACSMPAWHRMETKKEERYWETRDDYVRKAEKNAEKSKSSGRGQEHLEKNQEKPGEYDRNHKIVEAAQSTTGKISEMVQNPSEAQERPEINDVFDEMETCAKDAPTRNAVGLIKDMPICFPPEEPEQAELNYLAEQQSGDPRDSAAVQQVQQVGLGHSKDADYVGREFNKLLNAGEIDPLPDLADILDFDTELLGVSEEELDSAIASIPEKFPRGRESVLNTPDIAISREIDEQAEQGETSKNCQGEPKTLGAEEPRPAQSGEPLLRAMLEAGVTEPSGGGHELSGVALERGEVPNVSLGENEERGREEIMPAAEAQERGLEGIENKEGAEQDTGGDDALPGGDAGHLPEDEIMLTEMGPTSFKTKSNGDVWVGIGSSELDSSQATATAKADGALRCTSSGVMESVGGGDREDSTTAAGGSSSCTVQVGATFTLDNGITYT